MTERLYYIDSYRADFDATVVDVTDAGRRVYLDRTAFYPTSGGQSHDTGQLGGIAVVDVVDEDDRIAHLLAEPIDQAGSVSGHVDWPRRFDHMQQHTGQHLLSAVLAQLFDYDTVSVHFGPAASTLDLSTPSLTAEQLIDAEERANAIVTENRPVSIGFADAATVIGLRKASTREGTLRIVTIDALDQSACGGTHVRATGEIGPILLRKTDRMRGTVRLEFLCGQRAVRQARADHTTLTRLGALASASTDELVSVFEKQRAELKQADVARREVETRLNSYQAHELHAAAPQNAEGRRRIVIRENVPLERLRGLAQACAALPKTVFIGVSPIVPGVIAAASDDAGVDVGATLKAAFAANGGRGGGNARLAQGTVPDAEVLEAVVRYFVREE